MAELTLVEAVNDALHTELARDGNVLIAGGFDGNPGVDGSLSSTELYSP